MVRPISLTLLILTLAVSAQGVTYHVATTGDDARSCSTAQNEATPRRNIRSTALSCLSGGDTLVIRGGTYTEDFYACNGFTACFPSGTANMPTIIKSYPGELATLRNAETSLRDAVVYIRDGSGSSSTASSSVVSHL
jgi:hypothetical protein